jgi:hypothetical protein
VSIAVRAALALATLALVGPLACASPASFTTGYDVVPVVAGGAPRGILSVHPFEDDRPEREEFDFVRSLVLLLPLWPNISHCDERPDEEIRDRHAREPSTRLATPSPPTRSGSPRRKAAPSPPRLEPPPFETYAYLVSFARAIADDLRAAGAFERVVFPGGAQPTPGDLELRGTIRRTAECQTLTAYLLGYPGPMLWLLGIPNGTFKVHVEIDLWLIDSRNGAVAWRATLRESESRLTGLYARARSYGRDEVDAEAVPVLGDEAGVDRTSIFQWEFELLRRGMLDVRPALIEAGRKALRP